MFTKHSHLEQNIKNSLFKSKRKVIKKLHANGYKIGMYFLCHVYKYLSPFKTQIKNLPFKKKSY